MMKLLRAFGPVTSFSTLLVAAIAAAVMCARPQSAQEASSPPELAAAVTLQDPDWTAVTMAPDGAWGVATAPTAGGALAKAIANCKVMSKGPIGCGAETRMIRAGWIVGLRCGNRNVIAAGALLAVAERAARSRETELRQFYAPDMTPCKRFLAAGPGGAIATTMSAAGGPSLNRFAAFFSNWQPALPSLWLCQQSRRRKLIQHGRCA